MAAAHKQRRSGVRRKWFLFRDEQQDILPDEEEDESRLMQTQEVRELANTLKDVGTRRCVIFICFEPI